VVIEYTLGYDDVDINDLARFITHVVTGKEKDRDTQKRFRENIVNALKTGALKETSNRRVGASEFFKWAISYKNWEQYWPDIAGVKGLPSINVVIEAKTDPLTLTDYKADVYLIPNDPQKLKEIILELREENILLSADNEELRENLSLLKKELDLCRNKELKRKQSSSKGGRNSKGKTKNY